MSLDPATLLFVVAIVVVFTAAAYVLTWVQNREETAMLWMVGSCLAAGAGIAARSMDLRGYNFGAGNFLLLLAFGLITAACRRLRGVRPDLWRIFLPALLWVACNLLPMVRQDVLIRVGLTCAAALMQIGWAIAEVRLLPAERPASRAWLMATLGVQFTVVAGRGLNAMLELRRHPGQALLLNSSALLVDSLTFLLLLCFGMIALVKERSDRRFRHAALLDPMTGVGNRRHFDECLARETEQAQIAARSLVLIMIDADQFKEFNDLYGHPAGDRCLCAVAKAIQGACRPSDLVARYGGEEFAVLLPGTDQRDANAIAERMRQRVRDLRIEHSLRPDRIVTISVGVASLNARVGSVPPEELLKAADRALYRAKRNGRDQTCWSRVHNEALVPPLGATLPEFSPVGRPRQKAG